MQDRELVLEEIGALLDRRERQAELAMLQVVPASPDADLDPSAAHLVDGRHDLGERPRMAERDRRHERAEIDAIGLAREPREHRPRIGRRTTGRSWEARVVVGTEERLEAVGLGALGDGDLVAVGQPLLRLDHQREAHPRTPACRANRSP